MASPDSASQVYDELRRIAAAQLRDQAAHHTIQPTALVNEAWLKLAANPDLRFDDHRAYLVLASRVMRRSGSITPAENAATSAATSGDE